MDPYVALQTKSMADLLIVVAYKVPTVTGEIQINEILTNRYETNSRYVDSKTALFIFNKIKTK